MWPFHKVFFSNWSLLAMSRLVRGSAPQCPGQAHPAGFCGRHDGGRVLRLRLHCLRACARPLYLHHLHRAVTHHLSHRWVRRLRRETRTRGSPPPPRVPAIPGAPPNSSITLGFRVENGWKWESWDPFPWDFLPSSEGRRPQKASSHRGSQKTLTLGSVVFA